MHIFYDPNIDPENKCFTLSEEESGHACRVLRLGKGDRIELLDGKGSRYVCTIVEAHPKKCSVEIVSSQSESAPQREIHIAIAPTKNMERLEWFTEKATELGITHITLLECRNNERKQVKTDRLTKILISAMKQSKRSFLPVLSDLTPFKDFVKAYPNGYIAHCTDENKVPLRQALLDNNAPILIGPEGDFSNDEIKLSHEFGYKGVELGDNRLRTETAGLYACAVAYELRNEN
jgi:16S rRNA (uracil1498-N3)-methyltransferase